MNGSKKGLERLAELRSQSVSELQAAEMDRIEGALKITRKGIGYNVRGMVLIIFGVILIPAGVLLSSQIIWLLGFVGLGGVSPLQICGFGGLLAFFGIAYMQAASTQVHERARAELVGAGKMCGSCDYPLINGDRPSLDTCPECGTEARTFKGRRTIYVRWTS